MAIRPSKVVIRRTLKKAGINDTPFPVNDGKTKTAARPALDFDFDVDEDDLVRSPWDKSHQDVGELTRRSASVSLAKTPSNAHLVKRANEFLGELPESMGAYQTQIREFILTQALPPLAAAESAPLDADEVVKLALDESPDSADLTRFLRTISKEAILAKALTFVADLNQLTGEARFLFLARYLPQRTDPDLSKAFKDLVSPPKMPEPSGTKPMRSRRGS